MSEPCAHRPASLLPLSSSLHAPHHRLHPLSFSPLRWGCRRLKAAVERWELVPHSEPHGALTQLEFLNEGNAMHESMHSGSLAQSRSQAGSLRSASAVPSPSLSATVD
eukprot:2838810-Rhodomonas_salina.2